MSGSGPAPEGNAKTALGIGAVFSMAAVLPALPRVEGSVPAVWIGLAGGSALFLGPVLALARGALDPPSRLLGPLVGVALSAAPLSVFAAVLKATTHHRPLGAATFAVLALPLVGFFILVAMRFVSFADTRPPAVRRSLHAVAVSAAVGSLAAVLAATLGSDGARPHLVDALSLAVAAGLGLVTLGVRAVVSVVRRFGPALWIALVLLGLFAGRGPTFASMKKSAPVVAGPRAWL